MTHLDDGRLRALMDDELGEADAVRRTLGWSHLNLADVAYLLKFS